MAPPSDPLPGNHDLVVLDAVSLGRLAQERSSWQRPGDASGLPLTATPREI